MWWSLSGLVGEAVATEMTDRFGHANTLGSLCKPVKCPFHALMSRLVIGIFQKGAVQRMGNNNEHPFFYQSWRLNQPIQDIVYES